jgi:ornithine carbamoyltransferase
MRHFLDLADWSSQELWHIMESARQLKAEWQAGGNQPILKGKQLAMIFQKPSLRTRVSFEVAMEHLGGHALMLSPDEIGFGARESIGDISRVLSGYVQGIMARVFEHEHLTELARYATVPVINGLSDYSHPCQAMADMLTIYECFGKLSGVRFTYVGDGNNVATSLAEAAGHFGLHFTIANPPGYELSEDILSHASDLAEKSGGSIQVFNDPNTAVEQADVLYTDTWVSMGQESQTARRLQALRPYQVNQELVERAGKDVIVMHCLPAHRGQEITDEVADGPHSALFQQAANRLHVQKAILVQLMA